LFPASKSQRYVAQLVEQITFSANPIEATKIEDGVGADSPLPTDFGSSDVSVKFGHFASEDCGPIIFATTVVGADDDAESSFSLSSSLWTPSLSSGETSVMGNKAGHTSVS
jgi:hypothetical protein